VTHYDLALIGTGSGNTIVTKRFSEWRVAILEEDTFGGTCLNVGCIPTKMFVFPADIARTAQDGPGLGVDTSYAGARWPEIRDRIFGRIDPISSSGRAYRQRLPNIDLYEGHATFVDDHTLDTGTGQHLTADQIVIAAGSRSTVPQRAGLDEVEYHTRDTVMRLEELPERMVIVGGGYVAAEFAHVFSSLGTRVTQVHRGPVLLREHDEAVSHQFTELAGRQWDVRLNTNLSQVARRTRAHADGLTVGDPPSAGVLGVDEQPASVFSPHQARRVVHPRVVAAELSPSDQHELRRRVGRPCVETIDIRHERLGREIDPTAR
jgi:mycothione reductase